MSFGRTVLFLVTHFKTCLSKEQNIPIKHSDSELPCDNLNRLQIFKE